MFSMSYSEFSTMHLYAHSAAESIDSSRMTDFEQFAHLSGRDASISPDGLSLTKTSDSYTFGGAVADRWICPRTDCAYLAVRLVRGDGIGMFLGVTAREAVDTDTALLIDPTSRMYRCFDSFAWPCRRQWGVPTDQCRRREGDLIGLLVKDGRLYVFVNNEPLCRGPMAADLPERVRFCAEVYFNDDCFQIEPAAGLPDLSGLEL